MQSNPPGRIVGPAADLEGIEDVSVEELSYPSAQVSPPCRGGIYNANAVEIEHNSRPELRQHEGRTDEPDEEAQQRQRDIAVRSCQEGARYATTDEEDRVSYADPNPVTDGADKDPQNDSSRNGHHGTVLGLVTSQADTTTASALAPVEWVTLLAYCVLRPCRWGVLGVAFVVAEIAHVVVRKLCEAGHTHVGVGGQTLRLYHLRHDWRDGKPHDEAHEEVEPGEVLFTTKKSESERECTRANTWHAEGSCSTCRSAR